MPSFEGLAAARCWRSYFSARSLGALRSGQVFRSSRQTTPCKDTQTHCQSENKLVLLRKELRKGNLLKQELGCKGQVVEGLGTKGWYPPVLLRSQTTRECTNRASFFDGRAYTTAMPTDAQIKNEALSIIKHAQKLPSLVVFDLDYTIWPFWCEVKTTRSQPRLYPEVRGIIEALKEAHVPMAVASRTPSPNIATVFLGKLQLTSFFAQQEIYPTFTHKTEHFKAILQGTKVPYEEMLFFDDEDRNVNTISPLGVKCVLVEDGVNLNALKEGLAKFPSSQSKSSV